MNDGTVRRGYSGLVDDHDGAWNLPAAAGGGRSRARGVEALCEDRFEDDKPLGGVLGTSSTSGVTRSGVDAEALLSIDHGALRLRPLAEPGWGREGIAYGPFPRQAGLAFVAHVLNGHNASQTYQGNLDRKTRARAWLADARRGRFRHPRHHENLAVGLYPSPVPSRPDRSGNGFVMHAATADNGELWVTVGGRPLRIGYGVQNLQIVYVVVLREQGAIYYAASLPNAVQLGAYPSMRPLAIDADSHGPTEVFAGIHQRILGEVGYRVDTRVHALRVQNVPEYATWFGTAVAADTLRGEGALTATSPEQGSAWRAFGADVRRTPAGARSCGGLGWGAALCDGAVSLGLVHARVTIGRRGGEAGLVWRTKPAHLDGAWSFTVTGGAARLSRYGDGEWRVVESSKKWHATIDREHSVQVLEHRGRFGLYLDDRLVFDRWTDAPSPATSTVAGFRTAGDATVRAFEAHPVDVPIPEPLNLGPPWAHPASERVFQERFEQAADDLDGLPVASSSTRRWRRAEGAGVIRTASGHAQVHADREHPNPGRTIYTTDWESPDLADLSLEMIPPGTAPGEGHAGRGGVVFWQDADNYLVVNVFLDDTFDGASISSFYHLNGKEVMYDAVWTLVRGVTHGASCTLRVAFDGMRFLAYIGEEPCLYRALTDVYVGARRLRINQIGVIVNWEWGDDTGTRFVSLEARGTKSR